MGKSEIWDKFLDQFFCVREDGIQISRAKSIAALHTGSEGYNGWIKLTESKMIFRDNAVIINYVADEYEPVFDQNLHITYRVINSYIKVNNESKMLNSQVFEIPHPPGETDTPVKILEKHIECYQLNDINTREIALEKGEPYIQKQGTAKEVLL